MKTPDVVQEVIDVNDPRPRCRRLHYNFETVPYMEPVQLRCKACGSQFLVGKDVVRRVTTFRRPAPRLDS